MSSFKLVVNALACRGMTKSGAVEAEPSCKIVDQNKNETTDLKPNAANLKEV